MVRGLPSSVVPFRGWFRGGAAGQVRATEFWEPHIMFLLIRLALLHHRRHLLLLTSRNSFSNWSGGRKLPRMNL